MKRMVDRRAVDHVPDLKLADFDGPIAVVRLLVDHEIDAVSKAQLEAETHLARWCDWTRDEALDASQLLRDRCAGWLCGPDVQCCDVDRLRNEQLAAELTAVV